MLRRAALILLLPLALAACGDSTDASGEASGEETALPEVEDSVTCDSLLGSGGQKSPLDQIQKIWNGGTIGPAGLAQVRAGIVELEEIMARANIVIREQLEVMVEETEAMIDNAMSADPRKMKTKAYVDAGLLVADLCLVADR